MEIRKSIYGHYEIKSGSLFVHFDKVVLMGDGSPALINTGSMVATMRHAAGKKLIKLALDARVPFISIDEYSAGSY